MTSDSSSAAAYGRGASQAFLPTLLDDAIRAQIAAVLHHPLWQGVCDGSTSRAQLATFALQDAWLISEVHRLDGLAIAKAPDAAMADVLIAKLQPKGNGRASLIAFGEAMGLTAQDFEHIQPLAGCAGLTCHFYYHLCRSSFAEAIACIAISETVFMEICGMVEHSLQQHYQLDAQARRFFSFHEELEAPELATAGLLEQHIRQRARLEPDIVARVQDAVRLSLKFEHLFYDTVMAHPSC